MSVTTPILRLGIWAKLGAGVAAEDGATEAAVDGAGVAGAAVGAAVGGTAVAALEQADTSRATAANMPTPLERMRIVPPHTHEAVRVRIGLLPMDRVGRHSSRTQGARPLVAS